MERWSSCLAAGSAFLIFSARDSTTGNRTPPRPPICNTLFLSLYLTTGFSAACLPPAPPATSACVVPARAACATPQAADDRWFWLSAQTLWKKPQDHAPSPPRSTRPPRSPPAPSLPRPPPVQRRLGARQPAPRRRQRISAAERSLTSRPLAPSFCTVPALLRAVHKLPNSRSSLAEVRLHLTAAFPQRDPRARVTASTGHNSSRRRYCSADIIIRRTLSRQKIIPTRQIRSLR